MDKKPEWLKVRYNQEAVNEVAEMMRELKLNTVCKEANCPNLGECYRKHTSTFMILGSACTRNCRFCNVTHARPEPPDPDEPMNVAILTASGPGVDSDTAMKFRNSSSASQPLESTVSRISDTMP